MFTTYDLTNALLIRGFKFDFTSMEDSPFGRYVENYPENGLSPVWPDDKGTHGYLYAPTYQQVFNWFISKGIRFKMEPTIHDDLDVYVWQGSGWKYIDTYATDYEANEGAIRYGLTLLNG